ncbi:MAG: MFS transporter [Woeseiaceae bacterium]|nr:MFS transporter [Woeseiaceae bacterium]
MTVQAGTKKNALGSVLGLERHEYRAVAWSIAYFFCILSSYMIMRSIREMIGVASGLSSVPYLFTASFAAMLLISPLFAAIAARYRRSQFMPWIHYFFAANILIFYVLFSWALANESTIVWAGRAFFIWLSVFNLFIVSVFWSFMADIYSRSQSRRLFGVISAGGSAGAILGPLFADPLVVRIGFHNLLPICAALLLFGVVCIYKLRQWVDSDREHEHPDAEDRGKPLGGNALSGITHIAKSGYLTLICVKSVLASLIGTALYLFVNQLVRESIMGFDEQTQFFLRMNFLTNLLAFVLQLLVVRHAVGKLGLGWTLALMPLLSIPGLFLLASSPLLIVAAGFTVLRRGVGFGFAKPSTDMLYSVVSREEKYKSKNFIDTAVYRGGDLIGVWSVSWFMAYGIGAISLALAPFALIWVGVALAIGRIYRQRDASGKYGPPATQSNTPKDPDRNEPT